MQKVKDIYGKNAGRECQHYILSFAKDEINLDDAIEYAKRHAEKCFGDRFQVFVGIHVNSESGCLHAHYIVNSVSFVDGFKIQTNKDDYNRFRDYNDELAREYGLKIIDRSPSAVSKRGRPQLYSMKDYQLQKKVVTESKKYDYSYVNNCFNAVVKCLGNNPSYMTQFVLDLKKEGWLTNLRGKNIVFLNAKNIKQKVRANTIAKKYNMPILSSMSLLQNLGYDFNSDNYFKRHPEVLKRDEYLDEHQNRSITDVFSSFNIYNHGCSELETVKKKNNMKVKFQSDENECYDLGI